MSCFCPAPWNSIFYHVDSASVCCVNKTRLTISPSQLKETEFVQKLKADFLANKRPDSCSTCWQAEDQGLQSIRQHMITANHDINSGYKHMELRASNLCNFSCVMCFPRDSSEIAKEVRNITEENWSQVVDITKNLKTLILTGGEPMLIKKYYDLLDHLDQNIQLMIYTNCSVYNPKFVEKMLRIKNVQLQLSIDGVGETAELQRKGTDWETVEKNIRLYCQLPVGISIHATMTRYNIPDIVNYVEFLLDLSVKNTSIKFNAHTAQWPRHARIENLVGQSRSSAVEQLGIAIEMISSSNFQKLQRELASLKKELEKPAIITASRDRLPSLGDPAQRETSYAVQPNGSNLV